MILRVLLLSLLMAATTLAEMLPPDRVISRFYELLFQETPPSSEDEQLFFGRRDKPNPLLPAAFRSDGVSTPMWSFLRAHRHWFITEGHDHVDEIRMTLAVISSDLHIKPKGSHEFESFPSAHAPRPRILVGMLSNRVNGSSGYKGVKAIIFRLGDSSYLDPAGIEFCDSSELLGERIQKLPKTEQE